MGELFIIPLDLGDLTAERSLFYMQRFTEEKLAGKRVAAYIGGAKKKIVVDAGPPDLERIRKYHPYSMSEPRRPEQEMNAQLAKAGVRPDEIDIVILTHLHWDHTGDVTKFPNAEFLVSEVELRFALAPPPCLYAPYEALQLGAYPEFLKVINKIKTVDMREKEIVEGIRIVSLPGHTPGSIGVTVDTERGRCVIAGDAVNMYGNLQGNRATHQPYLMGGVFTDLVAAWKSLELVDEIVGKDLSRVIPGHDPLVFERERYP